MARADEVVLRPRTIRSASDAAAHPPAPAAGVVDGASSALTRPEIERVPGLDGIRGAAVVAVVAYHLGLLHGGFLGVDVFFVLSGFLVTSLLLADQAGGGGIDLAGFWRRRIRRLLPAILVMVPVVLLGALATGWPRNRLGSTAWDAISTLTWWANWRQASGTTYWSAGVPNLFRHAWSLSIEEQFYLAWPLVLAGVATVARRLGRSVPLAVGAAGTAGFVASASWMVVLAHRLGPDQLSRVYVGTDTRVFAPLAGCVLACWWRAHRPSVGRSSPARPAVVAVSGAIASGVLIWLAVDARVADPDLYRRGGFVLAALAATLLVWTVLTATALASADSARHLPVSLRWSVVGPVRYLGLRSYGLYLWSWPLQVLAERRFPDVPRGPLVVGVITLSLLIAEASYRLVEDPIRRGRWWARTPAARRPAWALGLAALVAVLALVHGRALPPPAHESLTTADALASATRAPTTMAPTTTSPVVSGGEIVPPAPPAPPDQKVMIIGDSVAFTAFLHAPTGADLPDGIASIDGRSVIGCGLMAGAGYEYFDQDRWVSPSQGACVGQLDAEAIGLTGRPDLVLSMPGAWEYEPVRSPEGVVYAALSPEMGDLLVDNLLGRARQADAAGAGFAMVQWACPGPAQAPERTDPQYLVWFAGILDRAAAAAREEGIDAWVVPTPPEVCEGGDITAPPTQAKLDATEDGIHFVDRGGATWFWETWIAPAISAHLAAG